MTQISARIVADSIAYNSGTRLTTMLLRYPRVIHAEFMTHRVFSRNASSSRAIPVQRLIQDVHDHPFVPLHWGKNQKGMQANEECDAPVDIPDFGAGLTSTHSREEAWLAAKNYAVMVARALSDAGYHKQLVNRLLEPFAHINVVVTATQWSNFFALRDHPDAEPHIRILAQRMHEALDGSIPKNLAFGQWHLPFVNEIEREHFSLPEQIAASVARCARTSYLTHDRKPPRIEDDIDLCQRLLSSVPLHASPAEHQATPDSIRLTHGDGSFLWNHPDQHGNLKGWIQYRKTLPNECQ